MLESREVLVLKAHNEQVLGKGGEGVLNLILQSYALGRSLLLYKEISI